AVAFERLLSNGENFVQRLLAGLSDGRAWPQLVHIATDGESYGHHHPHGDMALAYALNRLDNMRAEATDSAPIDETTSPEPLAAANAVDPGSASPAAATPATGEAADEGAALSSESLERSAESQVTRPVVALTNYGEFLEHHPAENQVEVLQKSSWS